MWAFIYRHCPHITDISLYVLEGFLEVILVCPTGIMELLIYYDNFMNTCIPPKRKFTRNCSSPNTYMLKVNYIEIMKLHIYCDNMRNIQNAEKRVTGFKGV
jgi:hypothetical protein